MSESVCVCVWVCVYFCVWLIPVSQIRLNKYEFLHPPDSCLTLKDFLELVLHLYEVRSKKKVSPGVTWKLVIGRSSFMLPVYVSTIGHIFWKAGVFLTLWNKATKRWKVKFMTVKERWLSSKLSVFRKTLAAYVKTTLNLHFINFSAFALSEFIYWKKDITHNNSLLIVKEASCIFKKNIKQLFPDEGSL